ncbi:SRPBCC family protein [Arthrobacter cryoconiti]|uniref:SRPBCC family protein n=1 Tax=Arthrobacter cryoconiti TaxID=748907 RepID=A0ABV8R270_9MICC|nr:SRPBCC family protein [Arthrobacter cryoconiti]MCC9068125.1 SRPBCC family protein [Arthrobacter cryoconiti]
MTEFDIDRSAPVLVKQGVTIHAPQDLVWRLLIDVDKWTSWRSDVDSAELMGDFETGQMFRWKTEGLEIDSWIREVLPLRRVAWGGTAQGIVAAHTWLFLPVEGGVRIVTEESWSGKVVDADPASAQSILEAAIALWLSELQQAATGNVVAGKPAGSR